MNTKKIQDLVFATKKTYQDKEGKDRRTYTKIGTVWTNEEGKQSIILDFIPADLQSGYLNIQDVKPKT